MSGDVGQYTLEGAFCVLILAIAHKIYKMRCDSSSNCCGDAIKLQTHNSGEGQNQVDNNQADNNQADDNV